MGIKKLSFWCQILFRGVGKYDSSGEGTPSPAGSCGKTLLGSVGSVHTPPEPSRPAPVLDRRDSGRSLTSKSRKNSEKVSKDILFFDVVFKIIQCKFIG